MDERQRAAIESFVDAARIATGLPIARFDAFAFGDSAGLADELAALVVAGRKRATTGLVAGYEAEGEPLPTPGEFGVVLNGEGNPVAMICTCEVTVRPFSDVDETFAWDEGEGDRSLRFWRDAHRRFFGRSGTAFSDDSPVVCERFDLLYPLDPITPA